MPSEKPLSEAGILVEELEVSVVEIQHQGITVSALLLEFEGWNGNPENRQTCRITMGEPLLLGLLQGVLQGMDYLDQTGKDQSQP